MLLEYIFYISMTLQPLFIGGFPGGFELLAILLVAILLFGADKIPELARSTGEAMGEFKRGRQEIEKELNEMTDDDSEDNDVEQDSLNPTELQ